jgi:hypothetical protein
MTPDTIKSYLSYQPCEFKTDYSDTEHNYLNILSYVHSFLLFIVNEHTLIMNTSSG